MSQPIRTYRKALLHVAAVLVAIGVLLVLLSALFVPKNNSEEAGMLDAAANGVLGEPANTIDAVILGDSEVYNAISPMRMWGQEGITSYVCSTNVQNLPYALTLLKRATQAQTPRIVVLDTNEVYNELSLNDVAKRTLQDFLPVLEYHDRWKSLTLRDFDPRVEYTWTDPLKGFVINTDIDPVGAEALAGYMAPTDEAEQISRLNAYYLGQVIDYCRSIGAEPVLVSTPSTKNWSMAKHNAIAAYAEEADVDYIDLNTGADKVDIDWQIDTRDKGDHMNLFGATKVSDKLAARFALDYGLEDHRGDADYGAWDEALELYNAQSIWYTLFPSDLFPTSWGVTARLGRR